MKQAFIKLHLSILLAGFTGVFGKLISLNEGLLVWYRLLITAAVFTLIMWFGKKLNKISIQEFTKIGAAGLLLAFHWLFFYGSIKASNVSIGVICFSLVGFFTAILEPLINKTRISIKELLFSLITVLGIMLIFHFDMRYRTGILLGVVSSALCALFTIVNKRVSKNYQSGTVLLYEMIGGLIGVSVLLPAYLYFYPVETMLPGMLDCVYLLAFALFCTIGMYMLQLQVLKKVSAFTMNLSYNLEPVYSIAIAMLLFGEGKDLNASFYIGLSLIVLSVILQTGSVLWQKRKVVVA